MTTNGGHDTSVPSWPRRLDPAERYFWLLDRVACAIVCVVAELDRVLTPDELSTALAAVQSRHPHLRARIEVLHDEPLLVEARGPIPLSICEVDGASSSVDWATLLDLPFSEDGGPMVGFVSFPCGTDHSVVALVAHHALIDGLGAYAVLQQVLQAAESGERADVADATISPPPPVHDRFPRERLSAHAVRDVLSVVRAERARLPAPDAYPFHSRHMPTRRTRLHTIVVDPAEQLVSAARDAKATVHGLVAAAALQSAAALIGERAGPTLALATPTDLRGEVVPRLASDEVMLATGLLCTPYTVVGDDPELAQHITQQTRHELARGESHLFYRLAHAGSFAATETGLDRFASWLGAVPENIAVSNLGLIRGEGDPAWVRSLSGALSPSANQLAFVSLSTYRDQLTMTVTTDEEKLSRPVADAFVTGLARRVGARPLPGSETPRPAHPATGRRPLGAPAGMESTASTPSRTAYTFRRQ